MAFRTNKMPVLQTKSDSGAVASFNTALAMPLASCKIAVNAWQEGSGDPSPSNVRPIHGFSEVNATRAGYNLFDYDNTYIKNSRIINYSTGNADNWGSGWYSTIDYVPIMPNVEYELYSPNRFSNGGMAGIAFYDRNYQYISGKQYTTGFIGNSLIFTTPQNAYYMRFCGAKDLSQVSLSVAKQSKFEPYVTPTIYTIQLGQEVYGAEIDVVNGVAHCTHSIIDMGGIDWSYNTSYANPYFIKGISNVRKSGTPIMIPIYKYDGFKGSTTAGNMANYCCGVHATDPQIYIRDDRYTSASDFKTAMAGIPLMYELADPFDIQLTPHQIETIIGNNTIFADTGDVDLTYKDLDIAKRGNFREVFKLPS